MPRPSSEKGPAGEQRVAAASEKESSVRGKPPAKKPPRKKAVKKQAVKKKTVRKVARRRPTANRTGSGPEILLGVEPSMRGSTAIVIPVRNGEALGWVLRVARASGVEVSIPSDPAVASTVVESESQIRQNLYFVEVFDKGSWVIPLLEAKDEPGSIWMPVTIQNLVAIEKMTGFLGSSSQIVLAVERGTSFEEYEALREAVEALGGRAEPFASTESDTIPLHTDDPAAIDLLGRSAFAEALSNHVRRILDRASTSRWSDEDPSVGSLAIHLDGPWGSGKSSLLRLLADELRRPRVKASEPGHRPSWIVVEYNAWEREGESPPWWGLLNTIFHDAKEQLVREQNRSALGLQLGELWRRYVKGRKILWSALIAGATAAAAGIWALISKGMDSQALGAVAGGGTLAGVLYAMFKSVKDSVFASSAEGARRFASAQSDPAHAIRTHFEDLYDSLKSPLAVFLDDLDRCEPEFVVALLEGIQTLFRSRPVLFVAAADRRWISRCFQMQYESFAGLVPNPGHRLGDLFLEKVFQLSIRVPRISSQVHERYLDHLLHADREVTFEEHEAKAMELFENAETEQQVQHAYEQGVADNIRPDLLGQQAARRSSETDVQKRTEHALQNHAHLLERNPRAMKRLLNYYSISRATLYIEGVTEDEVGQEQLVRWLVAETRWPLLADCLRIDPEIIERKQDHLNRIAAHYDDGTRDIVNKLLGDSEVQRILDGSMSAAVIRHCAARLE